MFYFLNHYIWSTSSASNTWIFCTPTSVEYSMDYAIGIYFIFCEELSREMSQRPMKCTVPLFVFIVSKLDKDFIFWREISHVQIFRPLLSLIDLRNP